MYFFTRAFTLHHTVGTLLWLLALWVLCVGGFNYILPYFGFGLDYNTEPLLTTAYWLFSAGIAFAFFPHTLRQIQERNTSDALGLLTIFVALLALFYAFVVPALDSTVLSNGTYARSDFLHATPGYLLPKLADILFQQVVIVASILVLASYKNSVRFVSLIYGLFFVTLHMFLWGVLGGTITLLFTCAAALSALCFPYLIMRVNNGFVYSYMLHWLFYVGVTVVLRTFW